MRSRALLQRVFYVAGIAFGVTALLMLAALALGLLTWGVGAVWSRII